MKRNNDTNKKTTSEKPVSLHPLDLGDALKALLSTPAPQKPHSHKNNSKTPNKA